MYALRFDCFEVGIQGFQGHVLKECCPYVINIQLIPGLELSVLCCSNFSDLFEGKKLIRINWYSRGV